MEIFLDKPIFHDEPEKQAQHIRNLHKAIDIRDKRIGELMYMIGDICKSESSEQIFERVLKNHEDVKRCIDFKNKVDDRKAQDDEKTIKGNYFV